LKRGISLCRRAPRYSCSKTVYRTQYPEKIDAKIQYDSEDSAGRCNGKSATGFRHIARGGNLCFADRVQQRRQFVTCSVHWPRREIHFEWLWRDARERAAAIVFESVLISLLAGIFGAVLAWQLVPVVPDSRELSFRLNREAPPRFPFLCSDHNCASL